MEIVTKTVEETEAAGREFAKTLSAGDIVLLNGALGAGKTAFVRGVASLLAPDAVVSSPSYQIMHRYDGNLPLLHFDLYRIEGVEEIEDTGFFDLIQEEVVVLIEWGERVEGFVTKEAVKVKFKPHGEGENWRRIIIERGGENEGIGD